MKSINNTMSSLKINDIFDELIDENRELKNQITIAKKCLNVLIKFKTHLNLCFNDLKTNLNENNLQKFHELDEEFNEVLGEKQINLLTNGKCFDKNKDLNEVIVNKNRLNEKTINSLNLFNEDIIETNEQMICENIKLFVCDFIGCGKQFKTKVSLSNHKNIHSLKGKTFFCDFDGCDYMTINKIQSIGHKNKHKGVKPFKCNYDSCDKSFYSKASLESHIKVVHKLMTKTKTILKCDFIGCDYETGRKELFIYHMNRHNGIKPFKCNIDFCDKQFHTKHSLRDHIKYVHKMVDKEYKCDFIGCGYQTRKRLQFMSHTNRHKGIKPFKCSYDLCDKSFLSMRALEQHIERIHIITDKLFKCDFPNCNKTFKTDKYLRLHSKTHQKRLEVYEKTFVCNEPNCDYRTHLSYNLKAHLKAHSTERPFACDFEGCLKNFKNKYALKEHKLCHDSQRRIKCHIEGCDITYKSERNLKYHLIRDHSDEQVSCDWPGCDFTTKLQRNLWKHKFIHQSERNFVCDWPECDKGFKSRARLREHIRRHKSDKRFACHWPGCQYRCVDSGNIKKHLKVHEKNNF